MRADRPVAKIVGSWKTLVRGQVTEESQSIVPEGELAMRLQRLIGNGKASVSAGYTMGHSEDYGNVKAEAFVSVTLTCDQSNDGLDQAKDEASALALSYVQENLQTALRTAREMIDGRV